MSSTHAIGVDLGGTKILAGVVTRDGEVLRRHERAQGDRRYADEGADGNEDQDRKIVPEIHKPPV